MKKYKHEKQTLWVSRELISRLKELKEEAKKNPSLRVRSYEDVLWILCEEPSILLKEVKKK